MQELTTLTNSPYFWPLVAWSFVWKGFALWRAGTLKDKWWFIALFILNTFGVLEIVYIFVWSRREGLKEKEPSA